MAEMTRTVPQEPLLTIQKTASLYSQGLDRETREQVYDRLIALLGGAKLMVAAGATIELQSVGGGKTCLLTVPVTIMVTELEVAELLDGVNI